MTDKQIKDTEELTGLKLNKSLTSPYIYYFGSKEMILFWIDLLEGQQNVGFWDESKHVPIKWLAPLGKILGEE